MIHGAAQLAGGGVFGSGWSLNSALPQALPWLYNLRLGFIIRKERNRRRQSAASSLPASAQFHRRRACWAPPATMPRGVQNFLEAFSFRQPPPHRLVAGVAGIAGDDEIAHAGKAHEGFPAASAGYADARHFRQAAGQQGGLGVISQVQPLAQSGPDGKDVLDGSPAACR